jgi:hypothetical protein
LRGGTTKQSDDIKLNRFITNKADCFVPRNDGSRRIKKLLCHFQRLSNVYRLLSPQATSS